MSDVRVVLQFRKVEGERAAKEASEMLELLDRVDAGEHVALGDLARLAGLAQFVGDRTKYSILAQTIGQQVLPEGRSAAAMLARDVLDAHRKANKAFFDRVLNGGE